MRTGVGRLILANRILCDMVCVEYRRSYVKYYNRDERARFHFAQQYGVAGQDHTFQVNDGMESAMLLRLS